MVYNMLNKIAISGGSYNDWLETVYDHNFISRCETPVYEGGLSKEIVFQEVVSNSSGVGLDGNAEPLGTLAGRGHLSPKHKGGRIRIKVDEPSYIMGIVSITPRIDYSQGNDWDTELLTINDLHKPDLDQIGFQNLITTQMSSTEQLHADPDAGNKTVYSAGKQPAWINYMTETNKCFGQFAERDGLMWMTLNRRYEFNEGSHRIKDLTTYIDPAKWNYIFAQTDLSAMNFWVQIGVGMHVRSKMSAKIMPTL